MAWLLAVAVVRHGGTTGTPIGVVQLIPTAALVLALALLLELAGAPFGPAAGDNGAGAGVAISLVRALDAAPPRRLAVELVLQGAGEAGMVGLRHHLRSRRGELRPAHTIVLGIAAAGAGRPRWWASDGPFVPAALPATAARPRRQTARHRVRAGAGPIAAGVPRPPFPPAPEGFPRSPSVASTAAASRRAPIRPATSRPASTPPHPTRCSSSP